jgi:hypothetical protein
MLVATTAWRAVSLVMCRSWSSCAGRRQSDPDVRASAPGCGRVPAPGYDSENPGRLSGSDWPGPAGSVQPRLMRNAAGRRSTPCRRMTADGVGAAALARTAGDRGSSNRAPNGSACVKLGMGAGEGSAIITAGTGLNYRLPCAPGFAGTGLEDAGIAAQPGGKTAGPPSCRCPGSAMRASDYFPPGVTRTTGGGSARGSGTPAAGRRHCKPARRRCHSHRHVPEHQPGRQAPGSRTSTRSAGTGSTRAHQARRNSYRGKRASDHAGPPTISSLTCACTNVAF